MLNTASADRGEHRQAAGVAARNRDARSRRGLGTVKKPRRTPAGEMLLASERGRESRIFEERDVIQLLKSAIEREGDQTSFARRHGIDRTHLNQILNRKKQINRAVMKAL